jgi:hypothetical protein
MRYKHKYARVPYLEEIKDVPHLEPTKWKHKSHGVPCCHCGKETMFLCSRLAGVNEFVYNCDCGAQLLAIFDMKTGTYHTVFCSTDFDHPEDRYARQSKEELDE